MTEEYDANGPVPSPLRTLWEENYPFDYWHNRILKINPYNPQDKLEALFVLLQLSDTYATVLAAKLINPFEPWYMIVERLKPTIVIHQTLEQLEVETDRGTYIDLSRLEVEPDDLIGYDIQEEWEEEASSFDLLAADLLGCPASIDEQQKSIEFMEPPEQYVAACNGVVNFWKDHTDLLNDLKHGFRLLPFDTGTVESLQEIGLLQSSDIDIEKRIQEYQETKDEYLYFWRLEVDELADPEELGDEEEVEIGMRVVVYRANVSLCKEMASVTLRLLHNLFGRGGEYEVVDSVDSLVGEEESLTFLDHFMSAEVIYATGKPGEE